MALTFVVFVGFGLFAAAIRDHVISRPKVLAWMRRTFAGALRFSAPSSLSPTDDGRIGAHQVLLVHHLPFVRAGISYAIPATEP